MSLRVTDLTFAYDETPVLRGLSFEVESPGIVGLVGPNAAGKSTLLKIMAGQLQPRGEVAWDGTSLVDLAVQKRRETMSYMPQSALNDAEITVLEAVLLARLNRLGWSVSDEDVDRAMETLAKLDIAGLARRSLGALSGGQQQLVGIAQVLVKTPELLLMDEPTAGLDLQHRLEILERIRSLTRSRGMLSLLVLHDLNLAARFTDRIIVLDEGRVHGMGSPRDVLTESTLREVYGVEAEVNVGADDVPHIQLKEAI